MRKIVTSFIKNVKFFSNSGQNFNGRWNLKDNSTIKATLASMDCCGDSYCGSPANYSKNIQEILKEEQTKIDL